VYAEVFIARHAEHAELVTSQPIFVSFIDAGVALVGAAVVPLTTQSSGGSCMAFAFTLGLGVTTVATSIAARSLRVAVLWRRTNFQRNTRDHGERYLAVILVPLVVQALVMAGWQLDAPLVFERVVTATDVLGNPTSSYGVCAVTGPRSAAYLGVSVGLVALWVALTVATAVAVRRAPEEFHDAPRLVLVAALLAQIYFFSIPLAAAVYSIPVALYLVLSTMCFFTCMAVWVPIVLPRIQAVRESKGADSAAGSPPRAWRAHPPPQVEAQADADDAGEEGAAGAPSRAPPRAPSKRGSGRGGAALLRGGVGSASRAEAVRDEEPSSSTAFEAAGGTPARVTASLSAPRAPHGPWPPPALGAGGPRKEDSASCEGPAREPTARAGEENDAIAQV